MQQQADPVGQQHHHAASQLVSAQRLGVARRLAVDLECDAGGREVEAEPGGEAVQPDRPAADVDVGQRPRRTAFGLAEVRLEARQVTSRAGLVADQQGSLSDPLESRMSKDGERQAAIVPATEGARRVDSLIQQVLFPAILGRA